MRRFADSIGRWWRLALDVDAIGRVRTLAGVDLLASDAHDVATHLYHPAAFAGILFAAVEPQAFTREVDEDAFADVMQPAALESALAVFTAELSDFFPPPRGKSSAKEPSKTFDAWKSVRRLAGVVGVAPGPHTLRELVDMADGRNRAEWRQTSALLATLHNAHFKGEKSADDFFPFPDESAPRQRIKIPMAMLMPVFVPGAKSEPAPQ